MRGKCKIWLDKGYGFIATDGPDIFCHCKALQGGRTELRPGDEVEFLIVDNPRQPGKQQAANVEVV